MRGALFFLFLSACGGVAASASDAGEDVADVQVSDVTADHFDASGDVALDVTDAAPRCTPKSLCCVDEKILRVTCEDGGVEEAPCDSQQRPAPKHCTSDGLCFGEKCN
jgi:hypothetical protein